MNCPNCDSFLFKNLCACGWKISEDSTIEIKKMGANETKFPLILDDNTAKLKERLNIFPEKERPKHWINAMKLMLRKCHA